MKREADLDWEEVVKESFTEEDPLKMDPEELMRVNHMKRRRTFRSKGKAYVKSLRYDRAWCFQGPERRSLELDHRNQGRNGERYQKIKRLLCGIGRSTFGSRKTQLGNYSYNSTWNFSCSHLKTSIGKLDLSHSII